MSAGRIRQGGVFVEIGADAQQFFSALNKVQKEIGKVGQAMTSIGSRMAGIGAAFGAPFVAASVAGTRFDDVLRNVQASTGATASDLEAVRKAAMTMSQAMGVGPTEAAAGFLELLKAGMSLEDVLGGAGKAATAFAKVGGMAVADAAVVMADAMNVFKVSGDTAANTLSAAADASSTSIQGIALAFSQVSAVAGLANQSIQDTAAALAVLANAGVKGSDAGTSLKTMLMRLMAPADDAVGALQQLGLNVQSFRNADGTMKPLVQIIGTLTTAMQGMDQAAKDDIFRRIFGQDAIRAAAVLTTAGVDGFQAMRDSMAGAATVGDKFRTMSGGLSGATASLFASLERLAIVVSDALAPALLQLSQTITPAINGMTQFAQANPQLMQSLAASTAAVIAAGGALTGLGLALRVVSVAVGGFAAVGRGIVSPVLMAANAATFLGNSFATAGVQVLAFASQGVAAVAQFAAVTTAKMALSSAQSGAVITNYFAGTISIISATVARAAEGNVRAAAIGVRALANIGASGVKNFVTAGAQIARLTAVGGTQLALLGVQGSVAMTSIGVASTKTGVLTLASFAKATAGVLAYATASIGSAAATTAAWAAANLPLLALAAAIGGAILVVVQLTSLIGTLAGVVKESLSTAVSDAAVVFGDLKRVSVETMSGVYDAIVAGDLKGAMAIALKGLLAAWVRGASALQGKIDGFFAFIKNSADAAATIASNPLIAFDAIQSPEIVADRRALQRRQDARLNQVTADQLSRDAKAVQAENDLRNMTRDAGLTRTLRGQADGVIASVGNAGSMQQLSDLADEFFALKETGRLAAEQQQKYADAVDAATERLNDRGLLPLESAPPPGLPAVPPPPPPPDPAALQRAAMAAAASQAEVAGTFSAQAVGGMGVGQSLQQKQLDELKGIHAEVKKQNEAEVAA